MNTEDARGRPILWLRPAAPASARTNEARIGAHRSRSLIVQWHLTDRCNLRCRHCYQDDFSTRGFDLDALWRIAEEVFALHAEWTRDGSALPLQFTLTGGEPLCHPDLGTLLDRLAAHACRPKLALLTNGTLIDDVWSRRFAELGVDFVQLSVEGPPAMHDAIRGEGSFAQTARATDLLVAAGVRTLWSFTAHRDNWRQFPAVARLAHRHKVHRLWSDRLIPPPHADAPEGMSGAETQDYIRTMYAAREEISRKRGGQTGIGMRRALQFLMGGELPYHCSAGDSLIAIMPDGEVYPCRRLPISAGNLRDASLADIYANADIMQRLRETAVPAACAGCAHRHACRGGLRCLAYAETGNPFDADPGCWHASAAPKRA